jgi:Family of unknown function (DUF6069)
MKSKLNILEVLKNTAIVYLSSTIVNIILYFIFLTFGGFRSLVNTPIANFGPLQIATSSLIFSILGAVVFLIVYQFKTNKPTKLYKFLGYGFILIMAIPVFTMNIDTIDKVYFEISHLVLGIPFIEFLTKKHASVVV